MPKKTYNVQKLPRTAFFVCYSKLKYVFTLILLSAVILTSTSACGNKADITPKNIDELNRENSSVSFDNLCNEIFNNELTSNTLNLHYTVVSPQNFGIDNYSVSIGNYNNEAVNKRIEKTNDYLSKLNLIQYDSLSDEDKITYDIINWSFNNTISLSKFYYFDEPLSQTIGIQNQLPILFSEYKFREKKDIDEYLQLLSQIPEYYDEICQYEREKSNVGMFMADFTADRIIKSCNAFLSDRENHYLIKTFEDKVNSFPDLSDEEKTQYINKNKEIMTNEIFPAYEEISATLSSLKGTGTNSAGLANFENGENYYEQLLKSTIGSDRSADEYITMVDNQLKSDLSELAKTLDEDKSSLESLDNIAITETDPQKILDSLHTKMTNDFPESVNCTYNIKEISEKLQSVYSPAFYLTPPIDSTDENTIYINPAYNNDSLSLFSTLAHEGFPGHMYQNLYSASCQNNLVRNVFNFQGYSEGYATYAEIYAFNYLDLTDSVKKILALSQSISLGIYARLDLAIHKEGYTFNQAQDFLVQYGITDSNTATEIFQSIVEQPANYMSYYGGYLEFLELRKQAQKNEGDNFSVKEFHNYILSIGEAPFDILRKYMK